jgi:hypothetical protein
MFELTTSKPKRSRAVIFAVVAGACGLAAAVWFAVPRQIGDPDFDPSVASPAWIGTHPLVLIDEAHYNVHTRTGRYKPFADLLSHDGYRVESNRTRFDAAHLGRARVLVIANALGFRGAAQQIANILHLEGKVSLVRPAFDPAEIDAVERWVGAGGSLLLIADHAPCGAAAGDLSRRFGVGMTNWYAEDDHYHEPETDTPAFLVFSCENGLLLDHPITRGRDERERIDRVLTFTGQSLRPPPGSTPFLLLSAGAVEYPRRDSRRSEARSAAGLAQGVALRHGKGRVVVLGEAAMATSQLVKIPGWRTFHFGMGWTEYQDRQLVLNILHWLSGLLDPSTQVR